MRTIGNTGELACNIVVRMCSVVNIVVGTTNNGVKIEDPTQAICRHLKDVDHLMPVKGLKFCKQLLSANFLCC